MSSIAYAAAMSEAENPARRGSSLAELCAIMERLLAPDGCPWDREQTLDSLRPYLVEETYEVLEAMERDDVPEHREELGDLLLQIVFQSALRDRQSAFDIDDVVAGICGKLIRRHPHVFASSEARTADEVHVQWDRIKAEEKREKGGDRPAGALDGVPRALPALSRAQQLGARAARVGFDWPDMQGVWDKLGEETAELEEAAAGGDPAQIEAELGDLLFAAVNLARKLDVDAESALRAANRRFEHRFGHVESQLTARGSSPSEASLEEMDELWNQAKRISGGSA